MFNMDNIKFYRSLNWGDNLMCGGPNTFMEIANNELTNLFTDVPGEYCLWGGHRYRKIFIGNASTTDTLRSAYVFVGRDSSGDDSLSLHIGTELDLLYEIVNIYTDGWYGVGVLSTELIGRDTRHEGPVTEYFNITTVDSNSGFQVGDCIFISEGDFYEIAETKDVVWESANNVRFYLKHQLEHTFTLGATSVAAMLFLGDIKPEQTIPLWIRQTIPAGATSRRRCRPHLRVIGV